MLTVSITVENLDQVADINSYDITLDYGGAPVSFHQFRTDSTLTDDVGMTTAQNDDAANSQATIGAFGNTPLNTSADSGAVVIAVFKVESRGSGPVPFPDVQLNGLDPPDPNLTRAPFTITVGTSPIGEARAEGPGAAVAVEGTVTRAYGTHLRLQDESGPTGASGLAVRQAGGPLSEEVQQAIEGGTIAQGTVLTVRGTLSEREGLLLIDGADLDSYAVEDQGPLPPAQSVSLSDLQAPGGADYESELLRVSGLSFERPGATGGTLDANTTYAVVGENGTPFDYRVGDADETTVIGASIPQGSFTYEGVLGRSAGGFAFVPVWRSTGLPVELTRFEATLSGGAATLTWHTASETANAGFYVQHRPPEGRAWAALGFVESGATGGTADAPQSYRFRTEALSPGLHRFRLRQVDLDGTSSFSDTVRVRMAAERALSLTRIGARPARTAARFRVTTGRAGPATVTLYDALGRQVRRVWAGDVAAGTAHVVRVRVADLPSGTYFARLAGPGGTDARKLTVVR